MRSGRTAAGPGVVKERGVVHEDGTLHATVHIWIVRPNDKSGYDLLLQKRSECKDSNPGCWDIIFSRAYRSRTRVS